MVGGHFLTACRSDFHKTSFSQLSVDTLNFEQAELACAPESDSEARYDSRLMWTEKRHHYEFVGRMLRKSVGEIYK